MWRWEKYSSFLLFSVPNFSETTSKPRIIQFKITIWPKAIVYDNYFQGITVHVFSVTVGPSLPLFTIKMAKIWQNRGALHSAHWRVPPNFILYVSTLMLVLLSYHWFVSRSGPTFEKIAFNFRYVTLCTLRSLVGGILEIYNSGKLWQNKIVKPFKYQGKMKLLHVKHSDC